jgi:glycosyltransferase involved in cell wall biosynthesis
VRIALVSQEYPPETAKGGIGSQTFTKAHGLAARGHEVHVISRTLAEPREYSENGVRVTRIAGAESRLPLYTEIADWLTYSAEVAAAIERIHKATPLDIVDFPEWACEGYVYLLNRTEWNNIPVAIHLHGPLVMLGQTIGWPETTSEFYRTGTAMEKTILHLADAVFSSSRCSAEWCAKEYGLRLEEIPVIHTGVDTNFFTPAPDKSSRPTVVFAGKLARNKGVHDLVEACARLLREFPALRLRLIGRGEARVVDELYAIASQWNAPSLLEFAGFVDRSALPGELSAAHVFAAPSKYEGGPGFVYLEAMACGIPVLACEGSGAAEIIAQGENGLLVPPDDIDALAGAIRSLLADQQMRQKMSAAAREFVLAHADSKACLDRLEGFYESVVNRTARASR